MTRGPLAATDRRRQAGHKRPKAAGASADEASDKQNGSAPHIAHLFSDRRKHKNAEGKRAS